MTSILFYLFSGTAVLSAFSVIFASRPTRALLSLIVTMMSLSALYLLLGAPFVAMVNLIVYAGAVLVLFLFVIMLQGIGAKEISLFARFPKAQFFLTLMTAFAFSGGLFIILKQFVPVETMGVNGSIETVGWLLFHNYLIPFELTSFLLLLGVLAAVSLVKGKE